MKIKSIVSSSDRKHVYSAYTDPLINAVTLTQEAWERSVAIIRPFLPAMTVTENMTPIEEKNSRNTNSLKNRLTEDSKYTKKSSTDEKKETH